MKDKLIKYIKENFTFVNKIEKKFFTLGFEEGYKFANCKEKV